MLGSEFMMYFLCFLNIILQATLKCIFASHNFNIRHNSPHSSHPQIHENFHPTFVLLGNIPVVSGRR